MDPRDTAVLLPQPSGDPGGNGSFDCAEESAHYAFSVQLLLTQYAALVPWQTEGVAERGTFVVNPEGKIVAYEVNAGNVGRNADELLRKVQACQFVHEHGDEVCPAKWQPGAETLKPSLDLVGML